MSMRPTFLGIETALRGIQSNQKALDIVGHNLTNATTEGYTRQRVDQVSMTISGGSRYDIQQNVSLMGQGTEINGVSQIRDPLLDKMFREEYATVAYFDQSAVILSDIEKAINELGNTGINNAIEDVISALKSFSSSPDDATNASIVMNSMVQFTQVLNLFDANLVEISEQQKFNAEVAVGDVNSLLERIAHLNDSIENSMLSSSITNEGNYGPNELLDERNLLLDELAYYGDIKVEQLDHGVVNVSMGDRLVVEGDKFETLSYNNTEDGTITLTWQKDGTDFESQGGALKAYVDLINGAGADPESPNHNLENGIPYYQQQLDNFAAEFVNAFNNVVPLEAGGFKVLFEPISGEVTAENITVANEWLTNPEYIMNGVDKNGELDNTYIMDMLYQFESEHDFGEFSGTFEGFVSFVNTTLGQQVTYNTSRLSATTEVANNILDSRDAVSAVSDNEEAANMMMYNRAYQAVARLMTTLDEALNTVINNMGLVGR